MSGTITINSTDLVNAMKPQLLQMPEITQQSYSYVIWTDGTNYYAKNGRTGQIDFSGTDASTVIQNAIFNLPNGGRIFVKSGTYILNKRVVFDKNVAIVGENASPYVKPYTVKFVVNNTQGAFLITLASHLENCVIEPASGLIPDTAIQIEYAYFAVVRDVLIHGPFMTGIGINGYVYAFWNLISHVNIDRDGDIIPGSRGIKLYTTTANKRPNENFFEYLVIRRYDIGIDIDVGNHQTIRSVTLIEDNTGIRVNTEWNEIYGIRDELAPGTTLLVEDAGGGRGIYTGIKVNGAIILRQGGRSRFYDLYSGLEWTRRTGYQVFSGDGTTTQFKIFHGLPYAPSKILVTPGSNDAKGTFYVTADATYIYVNYSTAPPAGTNNVVLYWYAEV
jgi:hypothetical protein